MDITIYRNSKNVLDLDISKETIISMPKNTICKYNEDLILAKEYLQHIDKNEIIKEISNSKEYKKLVRAVGYKNANKLVGIGLSALILVATTSVEALANGEITKAASSIDKKMTEVFILVAIIGGWLLVTATVLEVGSSLAKGSKDNLIGIIVKYTLTYIVLLLMPTIIQFVRKTVLGW